MITKRPPTHTLTIEIPMYLDDDPSPEQDNALQDAINISIAASRAAYHEFICGDPNVQLYNAPESPPKYTEEEFMEIMGKSLDALRSWHKTP